MRSILSLRAISGRPPEELYMGAPTVVLVEAELLREDPQRASDEPRRAVRVPAGAPTGQLGDPAGQALEVVGLRGTTGQPAGRRRNRPQAEDARTTLARAGCGHRGDDARSEERR